MSYSDDACGQTISAPTDDEVAEAFRDTHPQCVECGERGCPFRDDGTWAPEHFNCGEDGLVSIGDGNFVHESCKPHYLTIAIRDEIVKILEERRGFELNAAIIGERANNGSIRLYELLRQLGVVEHKKG